jgi:peptidoglycan biosynthesis protein MviN/MurJ (putative lipid II flippase)
MENCLFRKILAVAAFNQAFSAVFVASARVSASRARFQDSSTENCIVASEVAHNW